MPALPAKLFTLVFPTSLALLAGAGHALAFATNWAAPAVFLSLAALVLLSRASSPRLAFYQGLLAGVAMYGPHMAFMFAIFGWRTPFLWLILAWPVGLFVLLLRHARLAWGDRWASALAPVLWMGLEYFRSELYYFRFSWLAPAQAGAFLPGVQWLGLFGNYGLGALYMAGVASAVLLRGPARGAALASLLLLTVAMYVPPPSLAPRTPGRDLRVAGVQWEHPEEDEAAQVLDRLATDHPEADLLVMSEYTFLGRVPDNVRAVLRRHRKYLVAGGVKNLPGREFYDVAYVVGPDGNDCFEQVKSVPVQLMDDGLPASSRAVWNSPWGKIGIGICYDVSYARVTDDLVRQGAQALVFPTMDLMSWGRYERRMLHGRMAPVRSAEYAIPTFGVWSSGESQLVTPKGQIAATAPYPGQAATLSGILHLPPTPHLPIDRYIAPASTTVPALILLHAIATGIATRPRRRATKRASGFSC